MVILCPTIKHLNQKYNYEFHENKSFYEYICEQIETYQFQKEKISYLICKNVYETLNKDNKLELEKNNKKMKVILEYLNKLHNKDKNKDKKRNGGTYIKISNHSITFREFLNIVDEVQKKHNLYQKN